MNDLPGDALPASVFLYFETLEGHDNVSGVSYGATPLRGMKSIRLMHQKRASIAPCTTAKWVQIL